MPQPETKVTQVWFTDANDQNAQFLTMGISTFKTAFSRRSQKEENVCARFGRVSPSQVNLGVCPPAGKINPPNSILPKLSKRVFLTAANEQNDCSRFGRVLKCPANLDFALQSLKSTVETLKNFGLF